MHWYSTQGKKQKQVNYSHEFGLVTCNFRNTKRICESENCCSYHYVCSAIFNEGRREEAAKYLRRVVAYDPSFSELLKQCEEDDTIPPSSSSNSTSKTS